MLDKTKKALKEEVGKTILPTCDPIPSPGVGLVKIVKALKEDIKIGKSSRCGIVSFSF